MIDSVWIKSFRCLSELTFTFSDGPLVSIISKNNVGKTSILEACYVMGHLSSFVTSDISQVVPFDSDASYMGVKICQSKRDFNYYLKVDDDGKKYINLNERPVRRKSDIQSLFRTVYISSDSLLLITSRPSYRRHQLDHGISQFSMSYRKNLATYKRLVSQKNRLLKDGGPDHIILQMNAQLAPLICDIQKERVVYLQDIEKRVQWYFDELKFVQGHFSIKYHSKILCVVDEGHVLHVLNQNLSKEKMIRLSNIGPHRDDYFFYIDDKNIKSFYSRGVCRILAYLFQLSQAFFIEEFTALPMLLLLDEPFSEVHCDLKEQLIQHIPSSFYVVYTSTQQDEISNLNKAQLYGINKGSLCKI